MNPNSSFPTGIYTPPFGALRKTKSKSGKVNSSSRPYRSQSTNESRLYRQILDWRRADAKPISRRSQTTSTNPNDLIKQMRSLNIKPSESARDCRTQEKEKTAKKRTRFVITDLSSNNLAQHDEKFFRPLTGREKQRRISVWVQNVEKQRAVAPDATYAVACDTPSTETTERLSASMVSQQGSSVPTPSQPHQHQHQHQQQHQHQHQQQHQQQHQHHQQHQHQHQRTGGTPVHRHQHQYGAGAPKRPHI